MSKIQPTVDPIASGKPPFVPRLSPEELAESHRELGELLQSWVTDGDETEQRETLAILQEALGARRVASHRNLFP